MRLALLTFWIIGNVAFWLHWFNRINATGLPRKRIKQIDKLLIVACFAVPGWVILHDRSWFFSPSAVEIDASKSQGWMGGASPFTLLFGIISTAALVWLAPGWIYNRYRLQRKPEAVLRTAIERRNMLTESPNQVYAKGWVAWLGQIPGNQLHLMETARHEIGLVRAKGFGAELRIAHFSDVHLTGYMHFRFYREAVNQIIAFHPDVILLSGDLIDYDSLLEQVPELLDGMHASLGKYFVLGNHDRRLKQVDRLRIMLTDLGWHDLGRQSQRVDWREGWIYLVGNERPWFDLVERRWDEVNREADRRAAGLRIGVSHSPDQIDWARRLELDLLFCGHTHGGQVRLPWIGPMVTPCHYGSRFAAGWYDCSPTLLHVSRGLSGTHPLRVGCPPEVSLITLRAG